LNSGLFKNLVMVSWLLAVGGVSFFLLNEEKFFALSGTPVARVGFTKNTVSYRSEDDTRWKFIAGPGHPLFDGDRISTGVDSSAKIDFGDGRLAVVGEDTNISVRTIRQQEGLTFIISMPSGAVGIETRKRQIAQNKVRFPIIIRSGGRDFSIEPDEEKGVVSSKKGSVQFSGKIMPNVKRNAQERKPLPTAASVVIAEGVPSTAISHAEARGILSGQESTSESVGADSVESNSGRQALLLMSPVLMQVIAKDISIADSSSSLAGSVGSEVEGKQVVETAASKSLPAASSVRQQKQAITKSRRINPAAPNHSDSSAHKEKIERDVLSKTPQPMSSPVTSRQPILSGLEVSLDTSKLAPVLFSFKSLSGLKGSLGELRVAFPKITPPGWSPLVELSDGFRKFAMTNVKSGNRELMIEDFGGLKSSMTQDGLPCASLSIRSGAKLVDTGGERVSMSEGEFQIKVCSYRDAINNVPVIIGLSDLDPQSSERPLIFKRLGSNDLRFQLIVTNPSTYTALLPIMERSQNIRVSPSKGVAESGFFIGKSGKVIMQVAGSGLTATTADRLMKVVSGDIVYKGSRSALFEASALSSEELKAWLSKGTSDGRKVFVHRAGRVFPISKDFIEERSEVAAFVKSVSSQIFTEKVEVVAYK
jgi:hypothetical protein